MAIPNTSRIASQSSADAKSVDVRSRADAAASGYESILFDRPAPARSLEELREPDFFVDLNLDQVLEAMVAGRAHYELEPFFFSPLHEVASIRYRHEVLRDLEKADVHEAVTAFAGSLQRMRDHLNQAEELHYEPQKQAWFLDAVQIYCAAIRTLVDELVSLELNSGGLLGLRAYVSAYAASERFTSLTAETEALKNAIAEVRYAVHTNGGKVTVSRNEGEPDYSEEVEKTFAKFQQGAVKSYLAELHDSVDMNHVEARIVEFVAKLLPNVFGALAAYRDRYRDYLDATIGRFDREVQFYLAYLELIGRFKHAGLPFCYPHVSADSKEVRAEDAFDIALANKLVPDGGKVVCNDFLLEGPERVFVVSGPNNGGKTTFARMVGQLHYLASLGLPVPGRSAWLFLPDRIFTHFEKEEDIETLRGKFEDELVRVHEILEEATSNSIIVMNESFTSTTLNDALFVGTGVMRRILELGCLGVYVTFVDEIASLSEATVSTVSQIVPENPAERTFKVLRKPADGLAYAWAIAEKHGLTYDRLMDRID
jgi:DNA mismatch repair protein MutS